MLEFLNSLGLPGRDEFVQAVDFAPSDVQFIAYSGIFLGMLLFISALSQLLSRRENIQEAKSRRMKMLAKGATTAEVLELLKPNERSGGFFSRYSPIGRFEKLVRHAGFTIRPMLLFLLMTILAVFVFLIVGMTRGLQLALVFGSLCYIGPIIFLRYRKSQRFAKLTAQLPDTLELMARGLQVGHPINATIDAVATQMSDPIATEFGLIFDQVSYGDDLVDAFFDFSDRIDSEDVNYLCVSIGIQHGTGGDLARVLSVLAQVIRDRIRMRQTVKAISAEGRGSASFLSFLPVFIYLTTGYMTPDYYAGIEDHRLYVPLALTVCTLVVINGLVMRKLVNFRI